jgi:hypothetical protein
MSGKAALNIGICLAMLLASPASANDWKVDDTISALDGSRSYTATVQSSDTIRIIAGDEVHSTLGVRCLSNQLEAYIIWPQLVGQSALDMRWRVDGGPVFTEVWSVSRDGSATFTENIGAFLVNLSGAKRATFQLVLANFTPLQATFDVAGADAIAKSALSACGMTAR